MVNRKPYTLMMLKKAMSDHNKEQRHKGLWKMTLAQLTAYITEQRLEIVVKEGTDKDTTPYVRLVNMRDTRGVRKNNVTRKNEYVDARYRGDRRTGRARQYLKPDGQPKGTSKRQGVGRQR